MKKKYFFILPGVVSTLLIGSILTVLTFQYFRSEIRDTIQRQLEQDAYIYTGMITNKVEHYITRMESVRIFFKFSETVTRDEFAGLASVQLSQEPGIKALCWVPQVEPSQRQDYEMNARKEGFSKFTFHPDLENGKQPGAFYFPAYYVEPQEKNSSIFGYVLNSESCLSKAFEKAIETGQTTSVINPLPSLVQKPANPGNECWIIVPIFERYGLSYTEQGRRQCLQGYLVGIIDVSVMINDVLGHAESSQLPVRFHIEDITSGGHHVFTAGGLTCCRLGFDTDRHKVVMGNRFEFVDRVWKIYCVAASQSAFIKNYAWMAWLVFPVGLLLTGLLVLYLYTLYCRNELADKLVEKRTRELREQKEKADTIAIEAERSSRAKSIFLAGMSHDIRTPMNVILGFCNLLAEESLSQDQKFYVDTIQGNSQNLLMLLNDILDLSKIEAGKLHIDRRDFDPQEILHNIGLMFRVSTQNRGLEFRIISMNRIPRMIRSDPLRIRQCLVNLIGNAIKFTHQGHVYVSVSYEKEHLRLAVEDTGTGIPPEHLENIFDAFSPNGPGDKPDNDCGSDLGLTITRQLARLMGGDVTVQSELGKGTIFTLDIPAESAEEKFVPFQEAGIKEDGWGVI